MIGKRLTQPFEALAPAERARRYRELADAAFFRVRHAKSEQLRADYLKLAAGWHAMAQEMEVNVRTLAQLEASQERLRKIDAEESSRDLD